MKAITVRVLIVRSKNGNMKSAPAKRDRDTRRDPHRQPEAQEEGEHDEHQDQPRPTIADQDVQSNDELEGVVVEDRRVDTRWQTRPKRVDPFLDGRRGFEHVLFADQLDLDHDARVAVEEAAEIGVLEAVDDRGDLAEPKDRAVGPGEHDDVFEVAALIGLTLGAQQDLAAARLDRAARQIEGELADGAGDLVEVEAVSPERVLRDLDRDLEGTIVFEDGLRDASKASDLVAGALSELLQLALGDRAGDGDLEDRSLRLDLRDEGALALGGERVDGVDPVLDLRRGRRDVRADHELGGHVADAFGGHRRDAIEIGGAFDRLLDADADRLLDLRGRGAAVFDARPAPPRARSAETPPAADRAA